jgi:hypothetical protein
MRHPSPDAADYLLPPTSWKNSPILFVNSTLYSCPPSYVHIVRGAEAHEEAAEHPGAPDFGGAAHPLALLHASAACDAC